MASVYSNTAGNARLAASWTATSTPAGQSVDGQSGFGLLVIGTSALSGATGVLATVTLPKPSVSISGKVATLLGVPIAATPSANGTAALAEFRDSAGNTIVSGLTVGVNNLAAVPPIVFDINVSTTTFQTAVNIDVISYTQTTT